MPLSSLRCATNPNFDAFDYVWPLAFAPILWRTMRPFYTRFDIPYLPPVYTPSRGGYGICFRATR